MLASFTKILLASAALALTACSGPNNVSGTLSVKTPLNVQIKNGQQVSLPPGQYRTQVRMKDRKNSEITVRSKLKSYAFIVPTPLKNYTGNFQVTASELKQNFAIQGNIRVDTSSFSRHRERQCVYRTHNRHECYRHPNGTTECYSDPVQVYGWQTFYEEGYANTKYVTLNFIRASQQLAQFQGTDESGDQITRSYPVSPCYRR